MKNGQKYENGVKCAEYTGQSIIKHFRVSLGSNYSETFDGPSKWLPALLKFKMLSL